jgi:hypothetical protein
MARLSRLRGGRRVIAQVAALLVLLLILLALVGGAIRIFR